ncbi:15 kDa protein A [Heterocephalus glaber]|uniref:15 kDa protein A n=1 Tax=Heterocephalus glaber TaxID=10181 RepID=G5BTA7_HETGA|nr:15 kDa protein A [Heterocephalus glaber]
MAGAWKVLVLVLCLAGVSCAHRRHRLRYEDLVAKALRVYNEGQQGRPLFRLVETIPPPQLNSTTRFPLNFRIRETVCTSTPERLRQPQNCAFLEGGEERLCNGQFSRLGRRLSLTVSCDRDCGDLIRVSPGGAEVAEPAAAAEAEVPPAAKYLYEKAKYDIISNILRNF